MGRRGLAPGSHQCAGSILAAGPRCLRVGWLSIRVTGRALRTNVMPGVAVSQIAETGNAWAEVRSGQMERDFVALVKPAVV